MTLLDFQLRGLRYPHAPVDISNQEAVRKLVVWLENMKIREYKIQDRRALADVVAPAWDAAFSKYLHDLECPVPAAEQRAAIQWLVAFATNLEYEDNVEKLARSSKAADGAGAAAAAAAGPPPSVVAAATTTAAKPAGGSKSGDQVFTDLQDPQVVAAVLQLVRAAHVGPPSSIGSDGGGGGGDTSGSGAGGGGGGGGGGGQANVVEQLQAAVECLVSQAALALRSGGGSTAAWPAKQCLEGVPLGFEVEGEALRTAATVLRLLYIRDQRRLQSQIDTAVVEMQEYTANPRTDSSLGKVGR